MRQVHRAPFGLVPSKSGEINFMEKFLELLVSAPIIVASAAGAGLFFGSLVPH